MNGLRIGVTSARKGEGLRHLLEARGAHVRWGPTLEPDVPVEDPRLAAETEAVLRARPRWVAASTGVGVRAWAAAAARHGLQDALRAVLAAATVAARGPKAVAALRPLGVTPAFTSPQETDADVATWLAARVASGDPVAVQLHGDEQLGPYGRLAQRGARLLTVTPYRCEVARDRGPAEDLIRALIDGELDVLVSTSRPAVRALLHIAEDLGLRDALVRALTERVAVAAVGPVTASAFEEHGVPIAVMPQQGRTGDLVRALGGWAERGVTNARPDLQLTPATRVVRLGTRAVVLGEREFGVLAALVRRPGVVCSPALLAREAWGHQAPADIRDVKHQIARIRRKLGPAAPALQTVRGVGYRYDPDAVVEQAEAAR